MALYTVSNGNTAVAGDVNQFHNLLTGTMTDQAVTLARGLATDNILFAQVSGDTVSRFYLRADGRLEWGAGGATARDVNLYRASADNLKTDDSLQVGANIYFGTRGVWLDTWLNQALLTTSAPTFGGITLTGNLNHGAGDSDTGAWVQVWDGPGDRYYMGFNGGQGGNIEFFSAGTSNTAGMTLNASRVLNVVGGYQLNGATAWITNSHVSASAAIGVSKLSKAQGSSTAGEFDVNQYAFASPTNQTPSTGGLNDKNAYIGRVDSQASVTTWRKWGRDVAENTITWDYLTGSGQPRLWASVDGSGNIVAMWEAEDPADPEFPDTPPIGVEAWQPSGSIVLPFRLPTETQLTALLTSLPNATMPDWVPQSIWKAQTTPTGLHAAMMNKLLLERNLEVPTDIREVYSSLPAGDRRNWYLQLWLRTASRILYGHQNSTLINLIQTRYRVDRSTGLLITK